jgi:hypothetical protein
MINTLLNLVLLVFLHTTTGVLPDTAQPTKSLLPFLPRASQHSSTITTKLDGRTGDSRLTMYSQRDLMIWPKEERRWLDWEVQIEYSGLTFFDGWVLASPRFRPIKVQWLKVG